MNRFLVALVVVALVLSGCNGADEPDDTGTDTDTDTDTGADGEATEVSVQIDGQAEEFNGTFLAYFPDEVTVHPGDTIVYDSVFTGEPHSITFGSVVQEAIDAFEALPPEALEEEGPPPPELMEAFERVPPMLPEDPTADADQRSINPCFVAAGEEIPEDDTQPCEVTEPQPFTGTEMFYNSGFLADGESFELQLADDIAPGTYQGFCTLHFTEMISTVTVVAEDEPIPAPDEVDTEGQAQLDEIAAALAPAVEAAAGEVAEGEVTAGVFSEEVPNAMASEFLPADLEIGAGEPVTWNIEGPHTVSFNAPEEARVLLQQDDDGNYHINAEALMPAGFEAPPPPEGEEEGPPPPVDAGEWDGEGFFSSGLMFGGPFTLAITEPGSYEYVCLIHPGMEGTVTVN